MISEKIIEDVIQRLVSTYDPTEIYLFGSYAWGKPTEDSDLDLLVVVEESNEKIYRRPIKASVAMRDLMIAKDILVYTEDEFSRRCEDATTLMHKIKYDGRKVYAKA